MWQPGCINCGSVSAILAQAEALGDPATPSPEQRPPFTGFTYLTVKHKSGTQLELPWFHPEQHFGSKCKAKKAWKADTTAHYFYPAYLPLKFNEHQSLPSIESMTRDTVRAFLRTLLDLQGQTHRASSGRFNPESRQIKKDLEYRALVATGFNPYYPAGRLWAMIPSRFASDDEITRLMAEYFDQ